MAATNFLQLPLINKETVGVGAQGEPQAIFQLVSPERQIRMQHTQREKTRRRGEEEEEGHEDETAEELTARAGRGGESRP